MDEAAAPLDAAGVHDVPLLDAVDGLLAAPAQEKGVRLRVAGALVGRQLVASRVQARDLVVLGRCDLRIVDGRGELDGRAGSHGWEVVILLLLLVVGW